MNEDQQILVRPFWPQFSTCGAGRRRVSASTFRLRPGTAEVKGKILVDPGASFHYLLKQLIWEAGGLMRCGHLRALFTCFTNTEHKYGGWGWGTFLLKEMPDTACSTEGQQKVHVLPLAWLFLQAFTITCHWNRCEFCTERVTTVARCCVCVFCCPAGLCHKQGAGSWQPLEVLPRREWGVSRWTKWFIVRITQRGVT